MGVSCQVEPFQCSAMGWGSLPVVAPMAEQLRRLPQDSRVSAGIRPPARASRTVVQVAPFQVRAPSCHLEMSAMQNHGDPQDRPRSWPQWVRWQAAARPAEASCQVFPQSWLTAAVHVLVSGDWVRRMQKLRPAQAPVGPGSNPELQVVPFQDSVKFTIMSQSSSQNDPLAQQMVGVEQPKFEKPQFGP